MYGKQCRPLSALFQYLGLLRWMDFGKNKTRMCSQWHIIEKSSCSVLMWQTDARTHRQTDFLSLTFTIKSHVASLVKFHPAETAWLTVGGSHNIPIYSNIYIIDNKTKYINTAQFEENPGVGRVLWKISIVGKLAFELEVYDPVNTIKVMSSRSKLHSSW